jgi:predicted dehydrogenase
MPRDVRVALIGAGSAAQVVHLPILKRLPDLEVTAIIDPQERKARTIAERFGIPEVYAEIGALADHPEISAVIVCTPNDDHEAPVVTALELGKHVLCERPLSTTSESVTRMIEAARSAKRQLMVAMNERYRYDNRAIRQFVASGELGDIVLVRNTWLVRPTRRPRRGWRRDETRAGGGVVLDLGASALDLAWWVLGCPAIERVSATLHRRDGVEETAVIMVGVAGGLSINVEVSWELSDTRDTHALYLLGTRGSARTAPFQVMAEMDTGLRDVTPPLAVDAARLYTESYRQEWAEFLRYVRGEKEVTVQDEQITLMRAIEACYRSAEEGREVVT